VARILNLPQRRHVRAACRFSIGVTGGGASFEGTVHDLGESGLYLTADQPIRTGTPLQLRFELPGVASGIHRRRRIRSRDGAGGRVMLGPGEDP